MTAWATCTACDMTDSGRRRQQLLQRQETMGYEVRKNGSLLKCEGLILFKLPNIFVLKALDVKGISVPVPFTKVYQG